VGGVARRATAIQMARVAAEHLLVLDAGHALLDSGALTGFQPGEVAAEALDRMGYDAVTLGSADLATLGPEGIARLRASAQFALLSANAYPAGADALAAAPYAFFDLGGRRVAVLGLSDARDAPGWEIRDPLRTTRRYVRELRRQADIIILLSHAGQNVDRQIALQVRGIDVIVVGGNQLLDEPIRLGRDDTLLIHADRYSDGVAGQYLGQAELTFDDAGRLADYRWERVRLDVRVAEDPIINRWLLWLEPSQPTP
jgi:5'-nucleotidase/UDP-sugar diphosphatase